MSLDILMKINEDMMQKQFLREHSYWYKYLNRSDLYYKEFIKQMKEAYKLTPADKLNKTIDGINTFKTLLDVLK